MGGDAAIVTEDRPRTERGCVAASGAGERGDGSARASTREKVTRRREQMERWCGVADVQRCWSRRRGESAEVVVGRADCTHVVLEYGRGRRRRVVVTLRAGICRLRLGPLSGLRGCWLMRRSRAILHVLAR